MDGAFGEIAVHELPPEQQRTLHRLWASYLAHHYALLAAIERLDDEGKVAVAAVLTEHLPDDLQPEDLPCL